MRTIAVLVQKLLEFDHDMHEDLVAGLVGMRTIADLVQNLRRLITTFAVSIGTAKRAVPVSGSSSETKMSTDMHDAWASPENDDDHADGVVVDDDDDDGDG